MLQTINALPTVTVFGKVKRILRALGITEVVIGIMCTTIGLMLMVDSKTARYVKLRRYSSYATLVTYNNYFEGVWCGLWILATGVMGVICGKKTVTPCMINTHMGLSIAASVFSFILVCFSLGLVFVYGRTYPFGVAMEGMLCALSFVAMGVCITSAKYCCQATEAAGLGPGCCGGTCSKEAIEVKGASGQTNGGQVIQQQTQYQTSTTQQQVVTTVPQYQPPPSPYKQNPGIQGQQGNWIPPNQY